MIAVCTFIKDFWHDRFCIENAIQKAGIEFKLVIGNLTDGKNDEIDQVLSRITENEKKFPSVPSACVVEKAELQKEGWKYLPLIDAAGSDFVCVLDSKCIVGQNWLYDLNLYYGQAKRAGITAIPEFNERKEFTNIFDSEDKMMPVWKTKDATVNGVMFFESEATSGASFTDEKEFCKAVSKSGRECFYIPNQIRITT